MDLYFLFIFGFIFCVCVLVVIVYYILVKFFNGELRDAHKLRDEYVRRMDEKIKDCEK
jgi:uncharacterized protein YneF (UPF0154 family)